MLFASLLFGRGYPRPNADRYCLSTLVRVRPRPIIILVWSCLIGAIVLNHFILV
jgi:hypothetical protein